MTLPSTSTLGGHTLKSPFLLAPLEGVSDLGFRRLCFEQGAALTFTEMVRARGLAKRNKATFDLVDTHHDHVPTGIQLMTTGPQELQDALGVIEELAFSSHPHWQNVRAIDLNFGCPSKDIIQIGAGPAMLKRRGRMAGIFDVLAAFKAQSRLKLLSVSAKIRLGLNQKEQDHKVFLPVVEAAEKLDWITVHARHAGQRSRDRPTWSAIGEAKKVAKVPVVGNGDVVTRADAERMHAETGCDAFLIARAAIASPWAFRALSGGGSAVPSVVDVDAEAQRYRETAERLFTKPKYREFHAANFARLRALAASGASEVPPYSSSQMPKNSHM
jgi:tRNA-dihydrouridine synthase B